MMGAAPGENEAESVDETRRDQTQPQRWVEVNSFAVGRHEVTRGQYRVFAEETGRPAAACEVWEGNESKVDPNRTWRDPGYLQDDTHPATCLNWTDAFAYVHWLAKRTGKPYRLLTESQWEYAARAGTTTRRYWGDDADRACSFANGADLAARSAFPNSSDWVVVPCNDGHVYTARVGSFQPNAFGLYDMLGNVWEWVQDCWEEDYRGAPSDDRARTSGDCARRVMRGGSWMEDPSEIRSAARFGESTATGGLADGFRVAMIDPTRTTSAAVQAVWTIEDASRAAQDTTGALAATLPGSGAPDAAKVVPSPSLPARSGSGVPGTVFRDCDVCPEMVVIPAGGFEMGAAVGEEEDEGVPEDRRGRSEPRHAVDVRTFAAGRYEVTRAEYQVFAEQTGRSSSGCWTYQGTELKAAEDRSWRDPGFAQDGRHPVTCVSWQDAKAYAAWLSQRTGRRYRLLTEAEWEFAARSGTSERRYWGEDPDQACPFANGLDRRAKAQLPGFEDIMVAECFDGHAWTAPVGSFRPNAFGLHDMLGNAHEWVEDCWNEHYKGAPRDGQAWASGDCGLRASRGGSWASSPLYLRSAFRVGVEIEGRFSFVGFRVARTD